jgi:hypothetical protein
MYSSADRIAGRPASVPSADRTNTRISVPHVAAGDCADVGASPCHIITESTAATVAARPSRSIIT